MLLCLMGEAFESHPKIYSIIPLFQHVNHRFRMVFGSFFNLKMVCWAVEAVVQETQAKME